MNPVLSDLLYCCQLFPVIADIHSNTSVLDLMNK